MAKAILTTVLIEDVLIEAFPHLEDAQPAHVRSLVTLLRPSLNRLVKACRAKADMTEVIERQRKRLSTSPIAVQAFEQFVSNMRDV